MQKNIILIILLIIVLITGFFLSKKISSTENHDYKQVINTASPQISREPNLYQNKTFGFSIEYPFNLQLQESSPSSITIGTINDLETNSEVEIRIFDILKNRATATSSALGYAKSLCLQKVGNIEISCKETQNEQTENLNNNDQLSGFYLEETLKNPNDNKTILTQIRGPFLYKLIPNNKPEKIIMFYPPFSKDPRAIKTQLIRDITDSLEFIPVSTESAIESN